MAGITLSGVVNVAALRGTGTLTQVGVGTVGDTFNRVELDADGAIRFGSGAAPTDVTIARSGAAALTMFGSSLSAGTLFTSAGGLQATGGGIDITTAGKGLAVAEGANAKQGTAVLVAGSVTVATTAVTANSRIAVHCQSLGTVSVASAFDTTTRVVGTSFTIHASQATDTSTVFWEIIEPG